ncbi:MAG: PhzF family phenazine biosynthesis protein, partial [Coriobacteriales bacterium]|nr:PhzF family phenazine biosynthesis protein [Coriobacteriales bacterium]
VKQPDYYELRWFTPELEVDLCGHATLGSSYVLFEFVEKTANRIDFQTQSGMLTVYRGLLPEFEDSDSIEAPANLLWMDFPSRLGILVDGYPALTKAFGVEAIETYFAPDILVVLESADLVENIQPDFNALAEVKTEAGIQTDNFGVIITAAGEASSGYDFVSRFFAPTVGVPEDPVTGRAHCILTPYWSKRLAKSHLRACQVSQRRGEIWCIDAGERVMIGGKVKLYLTGEINL